MGAGGSARLEAIHIGRGIGERGDRHRGSESAGADGTGTRWVWAGSGALIDKTLCCFFRGFSSLESR